jgi:hypothetical protein
VILNLSLRNPDDLRESPRRHAGNSEQIHNALP